MSEIVSRITIDPNICHGKPVVRGLRYPVEVLLEYLSSGETIEELIKEFSDLEREDFLACIEYANRSLIHTSFLRGRGNLYLSAPGISARVPISALAVLRPPSSPFRLRSGSGFNVRYSVSTPTSRFALSVFGFPPRWPGSSKNLIAG